MILFGEACAAASSSSLYIKVPRYDGRYLSREFASKMFERTLARLSVCQNRDVLWTELHRYNWSDAARAREWQLRK